MLFRCLLSLCLLPMIMPGNGLAQDSNPVVASVNGLQITRNDLLIEQSYLPPDRRGRPLAENYNFLLNRLIELTLLSEEAYRLDLEKRPDVRRRLELARKRVLREALLNETVSSSINEETLRARYEALRSEENFTFEEVRVRHITLRTQEEALAVIAEFANGANFAELAKERSIDPSASQGGDLGYFRREDIDPAFAKAVFSMQVGPVSEQPIRTQHGWHVVQKIDHRTVEPTLQALAPSIRQKAAGEITGELINSLHEIADIKTFTIDGAPR